MGMMMAHHRIRKSLEEKKKACEGIENQTNGDVNQMPVIDKMTVTELKAYAKLNDIDIFGMSKKDDIKARITEAVKALSNEGSGEPAGDDRPGDTGEPAGDDKPGDTCEPPTPEGAGDDGTVGGTA